jgi:hypothetical protein
MTGEQSSASSEAFLIERIFDYNAAMTIQIEEDSIVMIATIADLRSMEADDEKVWGVPNQSGTRIVECYLDSEPEHGLDLVIATLRDFLRTQCSNPLDCHPDDDDPYQTITLRVPRHIRTLTNRRRPSIWDVLFG